MSLLDKLQTLTGITHRTKSEKQLFFENQVKNVYKNGIWYMNEYGTVKDQHELSNAVNGDYQCGLFYNHYTSGNQSRFPVILDSWRPKYYHQSQEATIKQYTSNGSHLTTLTRELSSANPIAYTGTSSSSSSIPTDVKNGIIEIIIPNYYDSTNDIFYTGVNYTVTFSNLTTSVQFFNIKYT